MPRLVGLSTPQRAGGVVYGRTMDDKHEIRELLDGLLNDEEAHAARRHLCEGIADGLTEAGRVLLVSGHIIGPDRKEGRSPFGHGNDDVVGLAVVAQVGGELAHGTISLLDAGNLYGAAALMRQLVEVEYLAAAFAEQDEVAAEWLRADRTVRRSFWRPAQLRDRAGGRFLAADYSDHCDMGGHPTREAVQLLPDHRPLPVRVLWVDLAGHLQGIWASTEKAIEVRKGDVPKGATADFERITALVDQWLAADGFHHAMRDLKAIQASEGEEG